MENPKKAITVILTDIVVAFVLVWWLFFNNVYCENIFKFYVWFVLIVTFIAIWLDANKVVKKPNRDLVYWSSIYDISIVLTLAAMGQFLYAGLQAFSFMVLHSKYREALRNKEAREANK